MKNPPDERYTPARLDYLFIDLLLERDKFGASVTDKRLMKQLEHAANAAKNINDPHNVHNGMHMHNTDANSLRDGTSIRDLVQTALFRVHDIHSGQEALDLVLESFEAVIETQKHLVENTTQGGADILAPLVEADVFEAVGKSLRGRHGGGGNGDGGSGDVLRSGGSNNGGSGRHLLRRDFRSVAGFIKDGVTGVTGASSSGQVSHSHANTGVSHSHSTSSNSSQSHYLPPIQSTPIQSKKKPPPVLFQDNHQEGADSGNTQDDSDNYADLFGDIFEEPAYVPDYFGKAPDFSVPNYEDYRKSQQIPDKIGEAENNGNVNNGGGATNARISSSDPPPPPPPRFVHFALRLFLLLGNKRAWGLKNIEQERSQTGFLNQVSVGYQSSGLRTPGIKHNQAEKSYFSKNKQRNLNQQLGSHAYHPNCVAHLNTQIKQEEGDQSTRQQYGLPHYLTHCCCSTGCAHTGSVPIQAQYPYRQGQGGQVQSGDQVQSGPQGPPPPPPKWTSYTGGNHAGETYVDSVPYIGGNVENGGNNGNTNTLDGNTGHNGNTNPHNNPFGNGNDGNNTTFPSHCLVCRNLNPVYCPYETRAHYRAVYGSDCRPENVEDSVYTPAQLQPLIESTADMSQIFGTITEGNVAIFNNAFANLGEADDGLNGNPGNGNLGHNPFNGDGTGNPFNGVLNAGIKCPVRSVRSVTDFLEEATSDRSSWASYRGARSEKSSNMGTLKSSKIGGLNGGKKGRLSKGSSVNGEDQDTLGLSLEITTYTFEADLGLAGVVPNEEIEEEYGTSDGGMTDGGIMSDGNGIDEDLLGSTSDVGGNDVGGPLSSASPSSTKKLTSRQLWGARWEKKVLGGSSPLSRGTLSSPLQHPQFFMDERLEEARTLKRKLSNGPRLRDFMPTLVQSKEPRTVEELRSGGIVPTVGQSGVVSGVVFYGSGQGGRSLQRGPPSPTPPFPKAITAPMQPSSTHTGPTNTGTTRSASPTTGTASSTTAAATTSNIWPNDQAPRVGIRFSIRTHDGTPLQKGNNAVHKGNANPNQSGARIVLYLAYKDKERVLFDEWL